MSLGDLAGARLRRWRGAPAPEAPAPVQPDKAPKPVAPIVEREDEDWLLAAKEWRDLDDQIKVLESQRVDVGQRLAAMSPDTSARGGGVNLMRYLQEGRLDLKSLIRDLKLQETFLAKYRSAARQIVSVRRTAGHK